MSLSANVAMVCVLHHSTLQVNTIAFVISIQSSAPLHKEKENTGNL